MLPYQGCIWLQMMPKRCVIAQPSGDLPLHTQISILRTNASGVASKNEADFVNSRLGIQRIVLFVKFQIMTIHLLYQLL